MEDENDFVWTRKTYNPNSLRAQLRSIWKTKKKFEIIVAGQSVELNKIRLVYSPFWLKFGPCPPECDKKDLMHAVGSTFRVVIQSEIKEVFLFLRMDKEKSGSLSNMKISRLFVLGVVDWFMGLRIVRRYRLEIELRRKMDWFMGLRIVRRYRLEIELRRKMVYLIC
ncbi:hypothetical protein Gotri_012121 [Gossypium trilobum]|uniref:DUF4283 domain-containing protein n=1 Tax=Gossypium trilobum TaxID=34281 RepID=A0A7J9DP41_9ROSI|nr:hypothetical protein [Gossypium trilobum]